jgi:hypothetical protein
VGRWLGSTRYRDLLTSATQITSLHSSSLKLSENLKTLSQACNNPAEASILMEEAGETSEAEEVANMLPVAAHMKLLLDAPEGEFELESSGRADLIPRLWNCILIRTYVV